MPDPIANPQPVVQRIHGRLSVAGLNFDAIDFPPDLFPQGAILLTQHPGGLEIIDRVVIPRGALLAVLHPEQAARLRGEVMRAAVKAKKPGEQPL